jgi:hypothetical protein
MIYARLPTIKLPSPQPSPIGMSEGVFDPNSTDVILFFLTLARLRREGRVRATSAEQDYSAQLFELFFFSSQDRSRSLISFS